MLQKRKYIVIYLSLGSLETNPDSYPQTLSSEQRLITCILHGRSDLAAKQGSLPKNIPFIGESSIKELGIDLHGRVEARFPTDPLHTYFLLSGSTCLPQFNACSGAAKVAYLEYCNASCSLMGQYDAPIR
jgi:hypothetical protein